MKLSLIIPVYNLERDIGKCLNSIVNQDLVSSDFEVIIINDGSKDNSKSVIEKYTDKYSNFKLININNGGVSNARNKGLEISKGEYLFFIDGDDWLYENILNRIYETVRLENLEIAKFGFTKRLFENNNIDVVDNREQIYYHGLDFLIRTENNNFYPWQFIFNRKFLLKNKVFFNKKLAFCEDKEFVIRALTFTRKIKNCSLKTYNYNLERETAISANISDKSIIDLVEANLLIYNFAEKNIKNDKHRDYIKNHAITSIRNSFYVLTINSIWKRYWPWSRKVKEIIRGIKTIDATDKLFLLKKSAARFYIKYYLPRAIYHKTRIR